MDSGFSDGRLADSIDNSEAVFIVNKIGFFMLKCYFSKKRQINSLLALAVFVLTTPAFAYGVFGCPNVVASSANVSGFSAPWRLDSQAEKIEAKAAGFSYGPPADMADLKPDDVKEKNGKSVETWRFEGDYPKGKWLSCSYVGNFISLSNELPEQISECKVTYSHGKKWGEHKLESIMCK